MDFCLPQAPPSAVSATSPSPEIPMHTVPPDTIFAIKVFDRYGRPRMRSGKFFDSSTVFLNYVGGTIFHPGEESTASTTLISPAPHFFTSPSSFAR